MKFDLMAYWYHPQIHPITFMLRPFSWIFNLAVITRRWSYYKGLRLTQRFPVPVIIVGNITTGGTGKTPFVIWLARLLKQKGYCPGIVSRGVGGKKHYQPHWVKENDSPHLVGDEAKLLLQHTDCPLVIGINRSAAVYHLLHSTSCDIVISDDGLQHYRLGRDLEIAMVDGQRKLGNGHLLPAGPLRENPKRLNQVDFVIINGGKQDLENNENNMSVEPGKLVSMAQAKSFSLAAFPNKKVHAVAGIGHPEKFFNLLKQHGYEIIPHVFKDHYRFTAKDLNFNDDLPIIMTEKDAVKCTHFIKNNFWYLTITIKIKKEFEEKLLTQINSLIAKFKSSEKNYKLI